MRRTPDLIARDQRRMLGLHPDLREALIALLAAMDELGHPMTITDALRSTAQQQALYAIGRTTPGKPVTNCDGVTKRSNHQAQADGFGHAVDCAFLDAHGQPTWNEASPWRLYGEAAKALGLRWGGEFRTLVDQPHVEL